MVWNLGIGEYAQEKTESFLLEGKEGITLMPHAMEPNGFKSNPQFKMVTIYLIIPPLILDSNINLKVS